MGLAGDMEVKAAGSYKVRVADPVAVKTAHGTR